MKYNMKLPVQFRAVMTTEQGTACLRCGATVSSQMQALHRKWHDEIEQETT